MTESIDNPQDPRVARARYQAALATAIVAGLGCAVVAAALVWSTSHLLESGEHLSVSEEIAGLRTEYLHATDADARAAIAEQIRRRDLVLRRDYFGWLHFTRVGGFLMAVAVVVCLVAARLAVTMRRRLPHPPRAEDRGPPDVTAPVARWTVVGIAAALVGVGVFVYAMTGEGFRAEPPEESEGTGVAVGPPPTYEEIVKHWPRFRGPDGNGHCRYDNVPRTWDGKAGTNVAWKTEVPLPAPNSPIVWGDRVFLTGASRQAREVYCFDAATGEILWTGPVGTPAGSMTEPPEILEDTGYAASTAATDGRFVAAVFANADVGCFSLDGKEVWSRNLGRFKNMYGYASSLLIHGDTLIVQADQGAPDQGQSSLMALDLRTGRTAWETRRPVGSSWATPVIARTETRLELVTCSLPLVMGHNPDDGTEYWRVDLLAGDIAPSPVWHGNLAFAVNTGARLAAIPLGGSGTLTDDDFAWTGEDGLPDIVSPMTDGTIVLLSTTDGFLSAYAVADGKLLWQHELETAVFASPSLVSGTVYLLDGKGVMHLVTTDGGFKEVGQSPLGEGTRASPAFADGHIYLRGSKHLYCIGKTRPKPASGNEEGNP